MNEIFFIGISSFSIICVIWTMAKLKNSKTKKKNSKVKSKKNSSKKKKKYATRKAILRGSKTRRRRSSTRRHKRKSDGKRIRRGRDNQNEEKHNNSENVASLNGDYNESDEEEKANLLDADGQSTNLKNNDAEVNCNKFIAYGDSLFPKNVTPMIRKSEPSLSKRNYSNIVDNGTSAIVMSRYSPLLSLDGCSRPKLANRARQLNAQLRSDIRWLIDEEFAEIRFRTRKFGAKFLIPKRWVKAIGEN